MKHRHLIVTTRSDLSASFFDVLDTKIIYYDQGLSAIEEELEGDRFDVLYFRDPFNDLQYDIDAIQKITEYICKKFPKAISIDNITNYDDLLFEDKWRQYKVFKDIMPSTELLLNSKQFIEGKHIAKKRISSRARGIALQRSKISSSDSYIIQDRVNLSKEWRVYAVNGIIINLVSVRSSKSEHIKVKTIGVESINDELRKMTKGILERLPVRSFVGLDIAEVEDTLLLLEVNRSPQFSRYNQLTQNNIIAEYSLT